MSIRELAELAADILADVNRLYDGIAELENDGMEIHDRQHELQRQAAQEFAALNGWRWTEHRLLARTLARGGTHDGRWIDPHLLRPAHQGGYQHITPEEWAEFDRATAEWQQRHRARWQVLHLRNFGIRTG